MNDSEYLALEKQAKPEGRKTDIWWVISKHAGSRLGIIKWYPNWRQYCFYPSSETIWNPGCLATVQDFINEQMAARKVTT